MLAGVIAAERRPPAIARLAALWDAEGRAGRARAAVARRLRGVLHQRPRCPRGERRRGAPREAELAASAAGGRRRRLSRVACGRGRG